MGPKSNTTPVWRYLRVGYRSVALILVIPPLLAVAVLSPPLRGWRRSLTSSTNILASAPSPLRGAKPSTHHIGSTRNPVRSHSPPRPEGEWICRPYTGADALGKKTLESQHQDPRGPCCMCCSTELHRTRHQVRSLGQVCRIFSSRCSAHDRPSASHPQDQGTHAPSGSV
jgi:hypothetical protein